MAISKRRPVRVKALRKRGSKRFGYGSPHYVTASVMRGGKRG